MLTNEGNPAVNDPSGIHYIAEFQLLNAWLGQVGQLEDLEPILI